MFLELEEYAKTLKEHIRGRANEVSQSMTNEEKNQVHALIELLDELDESVSEFAEMVSGVWDRAEVF